MPSCFICSLLSGVCVHVCVHASRVHAPQHASVLSVDSFDNACVCFHLHPALIFHTTPSAFLLQCLRAAVCIGAVIHISASASRCVCVREQKSDTRCVCCLNRWPFQRARPSARALASTKHTHTHTPAQKYDRSLHACKLLPDQLHNISSSFFF